MDIPDAPIVDLDLDGTLRKFNLDNPELPDWVKENKLASGAFPYDKRLGRKVYEKELVHLQRELVKLQYWLQHTGERIMIVFEGRDAAGKGGTIERFRENLNPRQVRTVALAKPSDVERGQWYFQRYVEHFPTASEVVLFDRSWYNRAGVEPVMGFCTEDEHQAFLEEVPRFERMIVNGGTRFFKFWLNIGREMQLERFHERRHDPLKIWKLSPIDIKSLQKWDEYTLVRDRMFTATDTAHAPWTVLRANDKRRARLNAIRIVLHAIDYSGKDPEKIGEVDGNIVCSAIGFTD